MLAKFYISYLPFLALLFSERSLALPLRRSHSSCSSSCAATITVTVSGSNPLASAATGAVTVNVNGATATASSSDPEATGSSDIGDFGSCSVPQIQFGVGFDNRKETSFQPADQVSYNHGSADDIDIISQFICNTLTNSCGADQTAKSTCTAAQAAADAAPLNTGAQADAFNAVFGISTSFTSIPEVDDTGNIVAGTGTITASPGSPSIIASSTVSAPFSSAISTASSAPAPASTTSSISNGADFGSCTTPEIEFGVGFDGRKETSFQPVDQTSFNHGSADDIDVIAQFICDALASSCGANQAAKDTCAQAQTAAAAAPPLSGADADAFNAAFGITTSFATVTPVNDQGIAAPSVTASKAVATSSSGSSSFASSTQAATTSSPNGGNAGENLQTFTGSLGGSLPPAVTSSGSQFQVAGNSLFNSEQNALQRSCDVQQNVCANAANASHNQGALTVTACNTQQGQCKAAVNV